MLSVREAKWRMMTQELRAGEGNRLVLESA